MNELLPDLPSVFVGDIPTWLIGTGAFLFGALWGSFFNVAIYRWPRGMSVVSPPSHCTSCNAAVPWYRNLPIVGYVLLRGRTACCGEPLNPRYMVVELLSALLALALVRHFVFRAAPGTELGPLLLEALLLFFFCGGLLIATFTDLEWTMIPDEVSLPGAALGLATVGWRTSADPLDVAMSAGVGYLTIQLLAVHAYEALFGRRGMGEGDSKLLLFIGAWTGWKGVVFALAFGSAQGLLVVLVAYLAGRRHGVSDDMAYDAGPHNAPSGAAHRCVPLPGPARSVEPPSEGAEQKAEDEEVSGWRVPLPFGPFLAVAALEFVFFGDALYNWYFGFF